ncbi:mitochondrial carrier protein, putative [Plasmodium reichenowi]|uniref:Mitochondrial carrier protein, putative n=1 Tax=Plasmodium reichenowi TaxID=5854 RepID=A0A2P9DMR2_PLARE|nr:mitochondrial carrier protein, putative [Plasmodium reichenowi]
MDISSKNEEEKKKNKNKNKILVCGLISGILTKTLFAPFDRIKLFYQIQPMFNQYKKEEKRNLEKEKHNYHNKKVAILNHNIILKNATNVENKLKSNNQQNLCFSKNDDKTKLRFHLVKRQNVMFLNFKKKINSLKGINKNKNQINKLNKINHHHDHNHNHPHNNNNNYSYNYYRMIQNQNIKHDFFSTYNKKVGTKNINKYIPSYYNIHNSPHKMCKKILLNYYPNINHIHNNIKHMKHIKHIKLVNKNYKNLYRNRNNNITYNFGKQIKYIQRSYIKNQQASIKYRNIIQSFFFIIKEEGVLGLWKGNFVNTIRGGIVYSAKFGTNDIIKDKLKKAKIKQKNVYNNNNNNNNNGMDIQNSCQNNSNILTNNTFNYYESITAGYISGIIQKTLSYPLDLLSIRMALGVNEKYLTNNNHILYKKKSIMEMIYEIIQKEGFSGFYKGYIPTLLTGVPYVTLQMLFFDFYKNIFQTYSSNHYNNIPTLALYSSLAGSLSNLTSLIIVFPGDTVRKRMMNNGIDNKNYIYKNTLHCIKNIYYLEGIRNFYHGLFPSMLKCIPSGAIQFMSYEILKHLVSKN